MGSVLVRSESGLRQEVTAGRHALVADEPVAAGGGDAGPDPYALLLAALGACTAMTLRMYADRKQWPLGEIRVELSHSRVHPEDCVGCDSPGTKIDRIARKITLSGTLDAAQLERLADIAKRCPVHKTLTAGVQVADDVSIQPPPRQTSPS
jgi:putative redox protein